MSIYIDGKNPLQGVVTVSGARNSAQKLLIAALFSNEDIVLDNVPRVESVLADLQVVRSIGGTVDWIGSNKLLINGASISSYEIPAEVGAKYRTSFLLVGPLLFRFGKARFPKYMESEFKVAPINRITKVWKSLGYEVTETTDCVDVSLANPKAAETTFKSSTHTGTDSAILSALFVSGETIINNASEEPEVDDLILFCQKIGAKVHRIEDRKIKVEGVSVFRGAQYSVMPDKYEVAFFATAAALTRGNVIIKKVDKLSLVPFINFLTKLGVTFEINEHELKVWNISGELNAHNLVINPSPGFVPDWQPLSVLLLCIAQGTSSVHDTVYVDRFEYCKDLNRMGAHIEVVQPSSLGIVPVISDDSYDFEKNGEPSTVAKIVGPAKFRAERVHISDYRYADAIILAALTADGKSEILEYKPAYDQIENFFDKLISLGAKIRRE